MIVTLKLLPFRFLRRLEQALKDRDRVRTPSDTEGSDPLDSPKATSPLLSASSSNANTSESKKLKNFKVSRQNRVCSKYSFEPEREHSIVTKDYMSD